VADPPTGGNGLPPLSGRELELAKMYQDSFKHMMTFSSAAIAVTATVVGAFLDNPKLVAMLGLSIVLLAFGALAATLGLARGPRYLEGPSEPPGWSRRGVLRLSAYSAYTGVGVFATWTVLNFIMGGRLF